MTYIFTKALPDGQIIGVCRLLFHWTLHVGISDVGYDDRYCYQSPLDAVSDAQAWDGSGDPPGRWHKHPSTGRRRNPDTGLTWHESEARDSRGMPIERGLR